MPRAKFANNNHVIYGYDEFLSPLKLRKKRALLCYLTRPIVDSLDGQNIVRFSNSGIALSWARVLNTLGYAIDIIDWDNAKFSPNLKYDLVIFHGGKNFAKIFPCLTAGTKIIHFSTGSYWKFNNEAEDARIKSFQTRHNVKAERDRYIYDSEDAVNEAADGIIVLGDPSMRETFPRKYPLVITIDNASYPDAHFKKTGKDYSEVRTNYLFFAGSGNIHKGLDLLIDSFKDLTDEHLYIVTVAEPKFLDVFKKELLLPNIHWLGEVDMRSKQFYEAMDKCAFIILPSCSEGQAGSVVEAMNQGLIPIVSKETRLAADDYGLVLKSNSISEIKKVVIELSNLTPAEVEKRARKTRNIATTVHSPKQFQKNLKAAIQKIVNSTHP